ncbi:MAG: hypothetical protein U0N03_13650 [Lachnospiraceae bacterium]
MGKILRYEWKKQLFSKLIIGGILIVLTAAFVVGTMLEKERWQMTAMVLLVFAGLFGSLYVGIESLLVLNRDLRTKESHMLFMVPYSAWSILGAKVLAAFLQIVLTSVLFAVSFFLCFTAYVGASQGFAQFFPMLQRLLREWFDFQLDWKWIVLILCEVLISWMNMIGAGYASIIASRTVLVKSRLATPLAIILFLFLNWGMNQIIHLVAKALQLSNESYAYALTNLGISAVFTVVLLFASGWMAEKKLSV